MKQIVEENESGIGKLFDLTIQALIVLSLISFSLETLPSLNPSFRRALSRFEIVTVTVFSAEYIARVWVTDNRLRFIFSFYGVIDLMAILPFYVARGIDLRSIRVFRVMRLARAFKLLRFSEAARRFRNTFRSIRSELALFFLSTMFVLYVSSVGIYYFENAAQPQKFASVFHALWWSLSTLTTVGYGDMYPVTLGGRLFTFVVLMVGLALVAVPAGLIASGLSDTDSTK
jgi:voltage-gated potassium channel